MIESTPPGSWQDLQHTVARILREAGVATDVEKAIQTARGHVSIDVWACDAAATPPQIYLIECKRWRKRIPQTVVHAFRSVVGDAGANWGAIISATRFQPAAFAAARYSNVRLMTWSEFETLFAERWFDRYLVPTLAEVSGPLTEYTHVMSLHVLQRIGSLTHESLARFRELREKYDSVGTFCLLFQTHRIGVLQIGFDGPTRHFDVPLRGAPIGRTSDLRLPDAILDAPSYRALIKEVSAEVSRALAEFEAVVGEHA